jgi:hypothetical protein
MATSMRPDLWVLFISGLPRGARWASLVAEEAATVQKPFTSDRLAAAVRECLAG